MYFGIWQVVYLGLSLLGLGIALEQHGKPKTGKHNCWAALIGIGICYFILYMGGFFTK